MGDFRPESRGRSGGGRQSRDSRFGGRRSGGFDRGDRRPVEMHEATCAKCGKQCEVPFRPTGDRPVLCSNCFRSDRDSGSRDRNTSSGSGGISKEQFNELNTKLNKILNILESIDFEDDEDSEDEEESDSEETKESEDKSE